MSSQRTVTNKELADIFYRIADLLEIKGEVIYKILAYRKAADSLNELGRDIQALWRQGEITTIPGVGKAIAEKIEELLSTGRLEFYEKLKMDVPDSLADLLQVPDLGPKKVALFWRQLDITTLAGLDAAARQGKLRGLPGMGEKSEAKILAGIESLQRRAGRVPLGRAWPFAREMLSWLTAVPGVAAVESAGSLRRMRSTVGDIDLLAAAQDSKAVMQAFVSHPQVARVLGQGEMKASVEYHNGLRAQLWVHPPERFGTALQYATGSKDHNVRLRELALAAGYSLSEHALTRQDGTQLLCATEAELYTALGLPWIPPELREDRGEIQAARSGRLPVLVRTQDIQAELHCHTTWSDGKLPVLAMAEQAAARGRRILAITDHSESLGVAGGLSPERLRQQRQEIDQAQRTLGDKIYLLQGAEVEIRADGSLDYSDEVLASLDIVIASLHSGLRQPREKVTERLLAAIRNPHVDIIGHPTGRMIPDREGADLDMDAILAAAAECHIALEINANPARLDLDDIYARRALEMGILLSINTDAHAASDLELLHFGVATARRGWTSAEQVVNSWSPPRLMHWLQAG